MIVGKCQGFWAMIMGKLTEWALFGIDSAALLHPSVEFAKDILPGGLKILRLARIVARAVRCAAQGRELLQHPLVRCKMRSRVRRVLD